MIQEKFLSMVENAGYTDITLDGETSMPIRSAPFSDVLRATLLVLGFAALGLAAPYAVVAGAGGTVVAGTCLLGGGAILAAFTPTINPVDLAYLQADLTKLGYTLEDTAENLRNFILGSLDDMEIDGRKALNAAIIGANPLTFSLYITAKSAQKIFYIAKWFAKSWIRFQTGGQEWQGNFNTVAGTKLALTKTFRDAGFIDENASFDTITETTWTALSSGSGSYHNIIAYTYAGMWCYALIKTTQEVGNITWSLRAANYKTVSGGGYALKSIAVQLYDTDGNLIPGEGVYNNERIFVSTRNPASSTTGYKPFEIDPTESITINAVDHGSPGGFVFGGWEEFGPVVGSWPFGVEETFQTVQDMRNAIQFKWLMHNDVATNATVGATMDHRVTQDMADETSIVISGSDTMTGVNSKEDAGDKSFTMAVAPDALSRIREKIRDAVTDGTQAAGEIAEDVTNAIGTAVGTLSGVLSIDGTTPISDVIDDLGGLLPDLFPDMSLPDAPLPTTGNHSLFTIYKPDDNDLNALASYLWAHIISLESLQKLFNDPVQSLISLAMYPVNPATSGNKNITFGWQEIESGGTPISCPTITQKIQDFDMGQIYIGGKYGNFLDYAPYTKTRIYLPFIGLVELNTDDVMNKTLRLKYRIEFLTGSCLATISIIGDGTAGCVMYQYSGNCAMQIPLTAQNFSSIYSGLITTGASILGAAITGGGSAAATAGLAGAAGTVAGAKTQIQRSGSMQGNSGLLGSMKPYVIIETPISNIPPNYDKLQGYVSNTFSLIGDLQGYNELEEFDLSIVHATEEERAEIEQILKTGFFA